MKGIFSIPGIWFCGVCQRSNLPDVLLCRCGSPREPEISKVSRQISHPTTRPTVDKGVKEKRNGGPNKSEIQVYRLLQDKYPLSIIIHHGIKLFFSDKTSYTPDLCVYVIGAKQAILIEVKGGYRGPGWEQGYERYRRAKDLYREYFAWQLWEKKGKEWVVS